MAGVTRLGEEQASRYPGVRSGAAARVAGRGEALLDRAPELRAAVGDGPAGVGRVLVDGLKQFDVVRRLDDLDEERAGLLVRADVLAELLQPREVVVVLASVSARKVSSRALSSSAPALGRGAKQR